MCSTSDTEKNIGTVIDLMRRAAEAGCKTIFFPESTDFIAGDADETLRLSQTLNGNFLNTIREEARRSKIWVTIGLHELVEEEDKIYNTCVVVNDEGLIEATYRKIHLFDVDIPQGPVLLESKTVKAGTKIVPPVQLPCGKTGLAICYDLRFAEMALALRKLGSKIIIYPSAFTVHTGSAHWEVLLRSRAIETQCYVIAPAQCGRHNEKRESWGHAMIVDPWGTVISQCSETRGGDGSICVARVDTAFIKRVRDSMPVMKHRRQDVYEDV
ncbi:carbon-nitrogen hydrolase [Paraphysoderma sedebokerense]|nr:carbon-nitrogen hydrolase [Paraphysoderma sedebokerense]